MIKDLKDISTITCTGCSKGISMCKTFPCRGTPEEIQKLIDAGYVDKLQIDYWIGNPDSTITGNPFPKDVFYLRPAVLGQEKTKAGFSRKRGNCTFLTTEEKCGLHDLGLKPTEGKISCCKDNTLPTQELNHMIIHTWDTEEGRNLIENWKKLINYDDNNEPDHSTGTFADLLSSLFGD